MGVQTLRGASYGGGHGNEEERERRDGRKVANAQPWATCVWGEWTRDPGDLSGDEDIK